MSFTYIFFSPFHPPVHSSYSALPSDSRHRTSGLWRKLQTSSIRNRSAPSRSLLPFNGHTIHPLGHSEMVLIAVFTLLYNPGLCTFWCNMRLRCRSSFIPWSLWCERGGVCWCTPLRSVFLQKLIMYLFFQNIPSCSDKPEPVKYFLTCAHKRVLRLKRNPKVVMISLCSVLHHSGGRWHCAIWWVFLVCFIGYIVVSL